MEQMPQQVQAIIASEYPQVRTVFRRLAQTQGRVAVAGEAPNELDTVTLARDIKPHVALIDYRLPHFRGLDGNPMSRIYGLSAARAIAEEVPGATAVLVTNADSEMHLAEVLNAGAIPYLRMKSVAGSALMPLWQLVGSEAPSRVVFAELAVHHPETVRVTSGAVVWERVARISGTLAISGTISAGLGLGLLLSVVFAGPGAVLLAGGAVGVVAGWGGLRLSRIGARGQPTWEQQPRSNLESRPR